MKSNSQSLGVKSRMAIVSKGREKWEDVGQMLWFPIYMLNKVYCTAVYI